MGSPFAPMQKITPFLWFNGQAEEAARFYVSIFKDGKILSVNPMSTQFRLAGMNYIAFNGGSKFQFNPAISLFVLCDTQREIDYYWKRLSAGGMIIRCGWLEDKFGLSWQVVPTILEKLLGGSDREKADRAMQAMLKMKKLNIAKLRKAHAG